MSDTWYRDTPSLPPVECLDGTKWTVDGVCLNPEAVKKPWLDLDDVLDDVTEEEQGRAFQAWLDEMFREAYANAFMEELANCPDWRF